MRSAPAAQAGSPRAGWPGLYLGGGCVSPRMETPQPGQPGPVLGHLHSKRVFPDQREPCVFQCVPFTSGPVTEHH